MSQDQASIGPNPWVENLFRPLAIGVMFGCIALSLVSLVRLLFPDWDGTFLVVGCVLVALEANYSYRLVRAMSLRGGDLLRFRAIEIVMFFILLKIGSYAGDSPASVLADVQTWPTQVNRVFDPETVAAFVLVVQTIFLLYLVIRWKDVAPPRDIVIIRDKDEARIASSVAYPTPLETTILGPDGVTALTPEEEQRILGVRKVVTEEGMAILCSNCDGATPLENVEENNIVICQYCGVTLAVSSVFVPCEHHPEYLAATTCAVCGDHFCRRCLTAQDPPVDDRWSASTVFLCAAYSCDSLVYQIFNDKPG